MSYPIINILDLIVDIGEDEVTKLLSDFSCRKNQEIEHFVQANAVDFAKRKMSITYGVFNEDGELLAIFALTHKAVEIRHDILSRTYQKKIQRFAQLDDQSMVYTVSAFLIAQFGKNDVYHEPGLTGNQMMDCAFDILTRVQHEVGGSLVYLECEDKQKLLDFYGNQQNRFVPFGRRFSDKEQVDYVQMFRML